MLRTNDWTTFILAFLWARITGYDDYIVFNCTHADTVCTL